MNFADFNVHDLYHAFLKIQQSYYNGTDPHNPINVTFDAFMRRPIFAFDCSKSDETIKSGMVDVRLEIQARQNIPANTAAYCLIIHDNLVWYSPFSSLIHRDI